MDFNRYCRKCGNLAEEVSVVGGNRTFKCACTDTLLNYTEVIPGFTKDARVTQLKAMHTLMMEANDEYIYMSWIYLMPDCPNEDDFVEIAIDDKQYNECFDLFVKLIAKNGNRY